MKNGDWQKRFGARRREIDRKILLEVENSISNADLVQLELDSEREARERLRAEEARASIARAFGRPLN
jgi:hypothetical protein